MKKIVVPLVFLWSLELLVAQSGIHITYDQLRYMSSSQKVWVIFYDLNPDLQTMETTVVGWPEGLFIMAIADKMHSKCIQVL